MDNPRMYILSGLEGYDSQIGKLVCTLNYVRHRTLSAVEGMSTDQINFLADPQGNTIAALLLHIAAIEYSYQISTFEHRALNDKEMQAFGAALELGERGRKEIKGKTLEYCQNILSKVREKTLAGLKDKDDDWLILVKPFWQNLPANHHFMWFHVIEEEIYHTGQIGLLKRRLPKL